MNNTPRQQLDRVCAELGGVYQVAINMSDLRLYVNAEHYPPADPVTKKATLYAALGRALIAEAQELDAQAEVEAPI